VPDNPRVMQLAHPKMRQQAGYVHLNSAQVIDPDEIELMPCTRNTKAEPLKKRM